MVDSATSSAAFEIMSRSAASPASSNHHEPERRTGPNDRRASLLDRRNAERVADDPDPRRDPYRAGRRVTDGAR